MTGIKSDLCILSGNDVLSVKKTLECGQCFRWNADENGVYTGVAGGKALKIYEEDGKVICDSPEADIEFWKDYFDLNVDYSSADELFMKTQYLDRCTIYGQGIRILRQEPWEALCSFIISQCNNIPRIKKIVETLCKLYGDEIYENIYTFPEPQIIAPLSEGDLAPLRCGYRAAYILDAARDVCEGRFDLNEITKLSDNEAFIRTKELNGVGDKVANCFMLYGLHRMSRFPVDTWMKKALKLHFPADFDPMTLGELAGLAQQYIFYYIRSQGD